MITVAIFNIIFVFFAYLARYKNYDFCLKVSFFLIFLFLALRYDYGNDYQNYLQVFLDIQRHSSSIDYSTNYSGASGDFSFEPGWIFIYILFLPLGFFSLVAVLSAFNCFVYYSFFKKYVPPRHYWFAVFLYVFNPYSMLVNSSAMRQSLAISIFLFSIDYLYKKEIFRYFLCAAIASSIHSSAYILFPIYLLGLFNWTNNRILATGIFILYIFMYASIQYFIPTLTTLISNIYENYKVFEGGSKLGTGLGPVYYSILLALILFYELFQNKEASLLFKIAILGLMVKPFASAIMMLERMGFYFIPALICTLSIIILNIKNHFLKNILLSSIIFITLYDFYQFFQSDTWKLAFGSYKTIFSSPYIY